MGKYIRRTEDAAEASALVSLGAKLREALERSGLRQADIAERTGVSRSRVSQMIAGNENPTLRAIARFAHALGMEVEIVLKDREKRDKRDP